MFGRDGFALPKLFEKLLLELFFWSARGKLHLELLAAPITPAVLLPARGRAERDELIMSV